MTPILPEAELEPFVEALIAWGRVESPSYDAAAVNRMMDLATERLRTMGARIERQPGQGGFGDVVTATLPARGAGPGILVLGHLDTVHPVGTLAGPLPLRREGDKLFGPGLYDMKGGVLLALEVLARLLRRDGPFPVPVTVMLVPDEEVGSPSSFRRIVAEAQKHRLVLVPEPSREQKIVTGRHAILRYRLRMHGRPSHAGSAPAAGRSAIRGMARLIEEIESGSDPARSVTYSVGRIQGGVFVNVVPVLCEAEMLCVGPSQAAVAEIEARMAALKAPFPDLRLEVEKGQVRPLFVADARTMALYERARSIAADLGLDLAAAQWGGGSDGNFTGAAGVPTLDGLGVAGGGPHTFGEHVLVDEIPRRAELFARLMRDLLDRPA